MTHNSTALTDLADMGAAPGAPYLDFGARLYSPGTASWLSVDPLAEKFIKGSYQLRNRKSSSTPIQRCVAGFLFGKTALQGTFVQEKCTWKGAGGRLGGFLREIRRSGPANDGWG